MDNQVWQICVSGYNPPSPSDLYKGLLRKLSETVKELVTISSMIKNQENAPIKKRLVAYRDEKRVEAEEEIGAVKSHALFNSADIDRIMTGMDVYD